MVQKPTFAIHCYQFLATLLGKETLPLSSHQRNAVVLLVPDYGNIGDLAIGFAQEEFLKSLNDVNVISVPISKTYKVLRSLKRNLRPNDLVFLVGGGSMGDLYPRAQHGREFIVSYLKNSKIISFPQSIIYSGRDGYEKSAAREARALSRASDHLYLFAREKKSLEILKGFYPGFVGYAPDIVLSLIKTFQKLPSVNRCSSLIVLRTDGERALSDTDHDVIAKIASHYGVVSHQDHGISDNLVSPENPYQNAHETLEQYRRASFVITDRLHGMIFAAVTGTPCIVLPNTNHKITETFSNWIQPQCPFIILLNSVDEESLATSIKQAISNNSPEVYKKIDFNFDQLISVINSP